MSNLMMKKTVTRMYLVMQQAYNAVLDNDGKDTVADVNAFKFEAAVETANMEA